MEKRTVLLPTGQKLMVLEEWSAAPPLGLRFKDQTETRVDDGLTVTARPTLGVARTVQALRTGAGDYAFAELPGLRDVAPGGAGSREFLVEVWDRLGRYNPVALPLTLPMAEPQTVYLFSAPARQAAIGQAAIRGQLWDKVANGPAAFAVLEVEEAPGKTWYGVADERGCIAVLFPFPVVTMTSTGGSLPEFEPLSLYDYTHELTLRVRMVAGGLAKPDGAVVPDLGKILTQPLGTIWSTVAGPPQAAWKTPLKFGQELVLRTGALSKLLIDPA